MIPIDPEHPAEGIALNLVLGGILGSLPGVILSGRVVPASGAPWYHWLTPSWLALLTGLMLWVLIRRAVRHAGRRR